jgi:tetratricopeptide (TPR) repeat protein
MWTRWQAVLAAFLAAAAAVAALSVPFHVPWLKVAGAVIAAVGAVAALALAVGRARLEAQRERVDTKRRLRVPVARVSEVDPTLIGVDPAAQRVLPGGALPEYVSRTVDAELQEALAAALADQGAWFVVVVGASKTGKSRALFEALRRCDAAGGLLQLVAPVDGDALRSMLEPGQAVVNDEPAVLWLDDLEPFLNQGVTLQTLREWRSGGPVRIVAATYGGKGSDLVAGSTIGGLTTIAGEVLQHAREVTLDRTSTDEVRPLRAKLSEAEFDALREHGLAVYLVAGPRLQRKLITGRQSPGDAACPEGVAVVDAAVDWARCGRTDPISEDTLRTVWSKFLPAGVGATDDGLRAGLEWALRPVAATIALVQSHQGGYQAYDYAVRLRREQDDAAPPPEAVWSAAIKTVSPAQASAVAWAAAVNSRPTDALEALDSAIEAQVDDIAARAGILRGIVLWSQERREDADAAYQQVIDRYGEATDPSLRVAAAGALIWQAMMKGGEDAVARYQRVIDTYGDDPDRGVRRQVAWALQLQGTALRGLRRSDDALAAQQRVIDHYGADPEPGFRGIVAEAVRGQGDVLKDLGRPEDALAAYQRVIDRYGDAPEDSAHRVALEALRRQGDVLKDLGRPEDALAAYQRVIDRAGDHPDEVERGVVAQALRGQGDVLKKLGRPEDALVAYQRVIDRHDKGSDRPFLREQKVWALYEQGTVLKELGRWDDAVASYQQVVARYGDDLDAASGLPIALALVGQGLLLDKLARPEDAAAAFCHVIERYGDDADLYEKLAEYLATEKLLSTALIDRYGDPVLRPLLEPISRRSQRSESP